MPPFNAAKTKIQLRIAVQRLRMLQEKKTAQAKTARRDIATLVEQGKVEKARVKVENIINEDIYVELLELLELYCELLIARFGLLDQNTREPDPGISEGICAIIYAAPRTELKELHILRDMLMHKYGREFAVAVMENKDNCVSERITKKLAFITPPPELVDGYLSEIAKGYGVKWSPVLQDDDSSGDEGGLKLSTPALEPPLLADVKKAETETKGSSDGPALPDLPSIEDTDKGKISRKNTGNSPGGLPPPPKTPEDEFEALAKRFEALKRR